MRLTAQSALHAALHDYHHEKRTCRTQSIAVHTHYVHLNKLNPQNPVYSFHPLRKWYNSLATQPLQKQQPKLIRKDSKMKANLASATARHFPRHACQVTNREGKNSNRAPESSEVDGRVKLVVNNCISEMDSKR
ncbi:hypothetical protein E2C01_087184 [Portunus trituberculatus]|uniref:Uncharacterized protein n=1 Tax=Portunus trituberculatus TaxID=210409 RepID=A0A5B7J7G3_PORTR|nr:hypothetical protein [Portunus trituberculatus]